MPVNPYGYNMYGNTVPGGTSFAPYNAQSMTPYIPPQPQQNNMVNMVLVNSEEEAKNYPLSPGGSIFLMDSNNQLFYTKSVDFSGIATFKKYHFSEITENPAVTTSGDYITKEEFEEFKASLNHRNNNKPQYQKKERTES